MARQKSALVHYSITVWLPEPFSNPGVSMPSDAAVEELAKRLKVALKASDCKHFHFTLERGMLNCRLHFQCCVQLNKKTFAPALENRLYARDWACAVQIGSTEGREALKKYCFAKAESYIAGPWADINLASRQAELEIPTDYDGSDCEFVGKTPRPFQQSIFDILAGPIDDRKIIWVWDEEGKAGKTKMLKYLVWAKGVAGMTIGKFNDIMSICKKKMHRKAYVFNIPRTVSDSNPMKELYSAFECVKDGMIQSNKNDSDVGMMKVPHVIVFSNALPNFKCLTADKWDVYSISKKDGWKLNPFTMPDSDSAYSKESKDSQKEQDEKNAQGGGVNNTTASSATRGGKATDPPKKRKRTRLELEQAVEIAELKLKLAQQKEVNPNKLKVGPFC